MCDFRYFCTCGCVFVVVCVVVCMVVCMVVCVVVCVITQSHHNIRICIVLYRRNIMHIDSQGCGEHLVRVMMAKECYRHLSTSTLPPEKALHEYFVEEFLSEVVVVVDEVYVLLFEECNVLLFEECNVLLLERCELLRLRLLKNVLKCCGC